jgi:bacillithiol synthase
MHCTCIRQTELPHVSRLFLDALYHPDRLTHFYRHPLRDAAAYEAAVKEATIPPERRAALIAALRAQNPASKSLELLAESHGVAVVTGQQVGLFSGPAYTVYKALTAVKLARSFTAAGVPAAPVFWLATEDHDFAEVNHAWVFGADRRPTKIEMRRSVNGQPVGEVTLTAPPVDQLRKLLEDLPHGKEVANLAEETYRPGATMGQAFGQLLRQLLADFDILQVDPMLPAFRELAAPVLREALDCAPDLTADLLARNRELIAAGYHAQVHMEEHTSLFFLLENGKRLTLHRRGRDYVQNGRRFTTEELKDRAASLSPNALLRPVAQDSMLPTAVYVGGPGELAYLAQSEVIYRALLGRMPVAEPRGSFTLAGEHHWKLMHRYHLTLPDFFHGEEALRERIAATLSPPSVAQTARETTATVETAVGRLRAEMTAFDPTLARAVERSEKKIRYQLEKMARKAGREALRRDTRAARDAASLYGLIYPERQQQERLYSILPFVAEHGMKLFGEIYEAVQLDCPDHRLVVI